METWEQEYARRCLENKAAIERIQGKPMTERDEEQLGMMVYRQMRAEKAARAAKAGS